MFCVLLYWLPFMENWRINSIQLYQLCEYYQSFNKNINSDIQPVQVYLSVIKLSVSWEGYKEVGTEGTDWQSVVCCGEVKILMIFLFLSSLSFSLGGPRTSNIRPTLGAISVEGLSAPPCWPVPAVTVWGGHDKVIRQLPSPGWRWKRLLLSDFTKHPPNLLLTLPLTLTSHSAYPLPPVIPCFSFGPSACHVSVGKAFRMHAHVWMCDVGIRPHPQTLSTFCRQTNR